MSDISIPGGRIRSFVERIEHLDTELQELNESKKEVFAEAKAEGFDVKILKEIIKLRKQDKDERDEHDTLLDMYMRAMETAARNSPPRPRDQSKCRLRQIFLAEQVIGTTRSPSPSSPAMLPFPHIPYAIGKNSCVYNLCYRMHFHRHCAQRRIELIRFSNITFEHPKRLIAKVLPGSSPG